MVAGVAGAVLLPVVGIGVGLTQVTRGIWNTPEAIFERSKGRHWNQVLQQAVNYWNGAYHGPDKLVLTEPKMEAIEML